MNRTTAIETNARKLVAALRERFMARMPDAVSEPLQALEAALNGTCEERSPALSLAESEIVKATEAYERAVIERNEGDAVLEKLRDILHRTAIALKGPEGELTRHSFHDLPEVAARLRASVTSTEQKHG
jgi:hypothetical protein